MPLSVNFDASSSTDVDGTIQVYEWDFDDDGNADFSSASPTATYTFDNLLFTHAGVSDETVYKILEALDAGRADMAQIQPVLGGFSVAGMRKTYDMPYHPGALRYFSDKKIEAVALN